MFSRLTNCIFRRPILASSTLIGTGITIGLNYNQSLRKKEYKNFYRTIQIQNLDEHKLDLKTLPGYSIPLIDTCSLCFQFTDYLSVKHTAACDEKNLVPREQECDFHMDLENDTTIVTSRIPRTSGSIDKYEIMFDKKMLHFKKISY